MPLKIMMSAAEVSADLLAGELARQLKGCILFGMGGEKMRSAGVDVRMDITDKSSIGIIEALRHLPSHFSTLGKLKKMLREERPDAIILVDAQGLNMPLAAYAKSIGIKTIYFIAPQEWLWGKPKGIKKVVDSIDLIISIFKEEHEKYLSAGGNSVYFGHPLLDVVRSGIDREGFYRKFGLDRSKKTIALCPGSRQHEIKNLLPILIDVASRIKGAQFVLPVSSAKFNKLINNIALRSTVNIKIIEGSNYDVLANCDLVVAKSGTIVLECVLLGTPVIMFYKLSPLTYYIGKKLLGINLAFYSMPNILAGRMVVPEFVMEKATADNISAEALKVLKDPGAFTGPFKEVKAMLGEAGSTKKAAQKIVEFIGARP